MPIETISEERTDAFKYERSEDNRLCWTISLYIAEEAFCGIGHAAL
jgi:hypothetical protein